MNTFRNILVVPRTIDRNDPALSQAAAIAHQNGASITVLWPQEDELDLETSREFLPELTQEIESHLHRLEAELATEGLNAKAQLRFGKTFLAIIHHVYEHQHDLVIKTARGMDVGRHLIFGSTALHLLRKCPCPVWIVDPDRPAVGGIMAAIDPVVKGEAEQRLNEEILRTAADLARFMGEPLHVLNAWSPASERLSRNLSWMRLPVPQDPAVIEAVEQRHREALERITAPFVERAGQMHLHLERGMPEVVIPAQADRLEVQTLVMATMARSGIPGLLIGNTAEVVLNDISRSVFVIKPEGFVSPIAPPTGGAVEAGGSARDAAKTE
ncbi:MAG: universal stress protein [Pseudomonadota bacterium]